MVGRDVIQRRLAVLLDALSDLRRYRSRFDAAALQADRDAQHMVLHALYIAAQAAIDIAMHGSAGTEQPEAATYQEAFRRLQQSGLLDVSLRDAGEVDGCVLMREDIAQAGPARHPSCQTLHGDLGDLEDFARVAASWK